MDVECVVAVSSVTFSIIGWGWEWVISDLFEWTINFSFFGTNKSWRKVKISPGIRSFSLWCLEFKIDLISRFVCEGSLFIINYNESLWCHNSSCSVEFFGWRDWWGNSDNDITIVVASGSGEDYSNWVWSCFLGSTSKCSVLVSFEPFGEVAEFEVGIIKSKDSKLCGIVLSNKSGWRKRRAEEVLTATSLHSQGD